jgi:F-type H+-transporting ATPase subunit b
MASSILLRSCRCKVSAARATAPVRPSVRSVVVRAQSQDTNVDILKPVVTAAIANLILAAPSLAEAGKIFDFNLTLPIMASEFLLLMVFLEKTWFTPVGKVLDDRDALLREKLGAVKDNSGDVEKLVSEAADILKQARAETTAMINEKKNAKQAELDAVYATAKAKITDEVESAIAVLEKESAAVLKKLDSQVDNISAEVLKRVLPAGVKL